MQFTEDLLYYLWKFRLFNTESLKTVAGETVKIISTGYHNKNAGPDFEEAKIQIGDTLWAGSVEMHFCSSDWDQHKHATDAAYNNVILHVVYDYNKPVYRAEGTEIQTIELKGRIPEDIKSRYQDLMQNLYWVPCQNRLSLVNEIHIETWLSRVLIERLEEKSGDVLNLLEEYKGSWDDAFYVILARNFGFKTNALPFELLARSLPQQLFARHKNNNTQIEALIFGQAGFLTENPSDEYQQDLRREYAFLRKKYALTPLDQTLWRFLRLRPSNFPTIRLAQFAGLVIKSNHLFSRIIEIDDIASVSALFANLPINDYWKEHYRFGKKGSKTSVQLGKTSVNIILLNTVAQFLFTYGKYTVQEDFQKKAIAILEKLPAETNSIINGFVDIGIKAHGADRSQSLLQLKKSYCDRKKCLDCGIGVKLLNME
ncbi:DUF2851 family protein [Rubrolithibacter danxiaensis]|uniref:DUF2851 family protein n=1 Tax=Rubrolithibacter danxiaensis TaxID=3390805 RepID=UPI003BF87EA0